jgi:hypothetical protein
MSKVKVTMITYDRLVSLCLGRMGEMTLLWVCHDLPVPPLVT